MPPEPYPHVIRICPNGHVHLDFGFTTVHLQMEQFQALLQAGAEALREYEVKVGGFGLKSLGGSLN